MDFGTSDAAKLLERTRKAIYERCDNSVTLSRSEATEAVFDAWQSNDEAWKLSADEVGLPEEVKDTAIRFIQNLPLGFPQPEVSAEPDGHINLEWYRNPRRVISVSVGPADRLHWAALIGSESPRGSVRFIDRVPESILRCISRVFQG